MRCWKSSCAFKLCSCFRSRSSLDGETPMQELAKPKPANEIEGRFGEDFEAAKEEDILIIRHVDPCISINASNHHTSKYELTTREIEPQLVVRRGQPFTLAITLSRPYVEEKDAISFIFTVEDEEKPSFGQETLIGVPLLENFNKSYPWNVVLESAKETVLIVQVTTAHDSIVAKWKMDIDTKIIDAGAYSYSWSVGIYILFNPWCKLDSVYLKSDEWREESVVSDVGLIYRGTFHQIRPCIWKFQQYEKHILECSLYLIKKIGKVNGIFRADPVIIARALSAAVNSVDDNGVVVGNWGEDYNGGTAPTKWMGSMEILQQYYKKLKPVKYGQCWVFSGILTTICRAIGIPCRPVTNYKSAHDTHNSLTVDYFMDEGGKIVDDLNSDSIWNFHVWNEVWMQRPDLGRMYTGWQAIDSTPQEMSENMYRVGPASVLSVKLGEVKRPYDGGFLFAEVNADKVYWRYSGPNQPLKLLGKDIHAIGKLIVTKAAGKWEYEDITFNYKHKETDEEERSTMFSALRQSENLFARYYLNDDFNDIQFSLELKEDAKIGQPFNILFIMKNRNKLKEYKVLITLHVDAIAYTGKIGDSIKEKTYKGEVKAESIQEINLLVEYQDYAKKLLDQGAFNVSCLATVQDTNFEYYSDDEFRLIKPNIHITLDEEPKVNKEIPAKASVQNTLPVPLKKCEFTIDAPGFDQKIVIRLKKDVPPGLDATVVFKFTPKEAGKQTIAANFVSKELYDVDGFLNFVVESDKEESENVV